MMGKQELYALLTSRSIPYQAFAHAAVHTIEQLQALDIPDHENILKNLFLRDQKKKNYYLVSIPGHKSANLKELDKKLGSGKLSFASEEDLFRYLGLRKGQVSPLGVLNDAEKRVVAVFDEALQGRTVGIHPLDNTATIFMAFSDVVRLVEEHGNRTVYGSF